jgi:hypothetical protein
MKLGSVPLAAGGMTVVSACKFMSVLRMAVHLFGLLLIGRICFSVHLHLVIDGQLGLGSAAAEARASLKSKLEQGVGCR